MAKPAGFARADWGTVVAVVPTLLAFILAALQPEPEGHGLEGRAFVVVSALLALTAIRYPFTASGGLLVLLCLNLATLNLPDSFPLLLAAIANAVGISQSRHLSNQVLVSALWLGIANYPQHAQEWGRSQASVTLRASLLVLVVVWVSGMVVRHQVRARGSLQSDYAGKIRMQRAQIAASLHDTIASANTSIVLQAEDLLGLTEADSALAHGLRSITRTARDNAQDLRAMMATLRLDTDLVPDPIDLETSTLSEYIESRREKLQARGITPSILCDVVDGDLSPAQRRAALRVCREAINNMAKYGASGPATIQASSTAMGDLELLFTNTISGRDRRLSGSGLGLSGLTEIVESMGGNLQTTQSAEGAIWILSVQLPSRGTTHAT